MPVSDRVWFSPVTNLVCFRDIPSNLKRSCREVIRIKSPLDYVLRVCIFMPNKLIKLHYIIYNYIRGNAIIYYLSHSLNTCKAKNCIPQSTTDNTRRQNCPLLWSHMSTRLRHLASGPDCLGWESRQYYSGTLQKKFRWLIVRLQQLQCVSNGATAVFY